MPIACRYKMQHGKHFCASDCPAATPCGVFDYVRVEKPSDLPAPEERLVDVALLDMNHGWPNLGHDSLVHAVLDASCDLLPVREATGIGVRVLSYDVRRSGMIPEPPGGRFGVYVGTGGPGHLDPRRNAGDADGSQGIDEDPSWEEPLFALFDAIRRDDTAALIAVCHTFGVMCRWLGIAEPVLRGPEKGGKSTGVLENLLSPEAERHPWFARFHDEFRGGRLRIVDNRLYDLVPTSLPLPDPLVPIGWETLGVGGPRGDALTMLEVARDGGGVMPRVFAVNHHPEIVDRGRQLMILQQKLERGEVSAAWVAERREILTRNLPDEDSDRRLHVTSDATLLAPLRFHVFRQVRLRAEALGLDVDLHEDAVLAGAASALVGAAAPEA